MNELIKIEPAEIGGETIQTCNARDLHAFLEVKSNFRDWIKNRIDDFDFKENHDYVTFAKNLAKGRPSVEYFLRLNMAKELSMVERTAKGKEARRYFIQCEAIAKQASARPLIGAAQDRIQAIFWVAKEIASTFHVSAERATASALATIQKDIGLPQEDFRALIPSVPVEKAALLNPTEVGKRLSPVISAKMVNQVLMELGFQERLEKGWKLTEAGAKYGENRPYERNNHSGMQIQWRDSIVPVLQNELGEAA